MIYIYIHIYIYIYIYICTSLASGIISSSTFIILSMASQRKAVAFT